MRINFAELKRQENLYKQEYEKTVMRVLDSGWYILGDELKKFERNYAKYIGVKHCIGVGNGLDALKLALCSLDIGDGDEVIVQANTFIATALAVSEVGATPVFVDCDHYFGIDPQTIVSAITKNTKAIMVVHLYGQPCDMDAIMDISDRYHIKVIEDCSQCHGAMYKEKKCGTFGELACFSFYPMKPIGAFGDAGAVVTNKDFLAEKIRMLRNYGSKEKYKHEMIGVNSRMDEIQAAVLGVSLKHAEEGNMKRMKIAEQYQQGIRNKKVMIPKVRMNTKHVYHVFPVLCKERDHLQKYLESACIMTQIHYPVPCHLAGCYKNLNCSNGDMSKAEQFSNQELSLPIYVGLTEEEVEYVIDIINKF
ncbi:MAG: DegT/DnrJ/EryC1/StrS family aminotransferase [Ruminococcus sp.]|nr:DegT/DnrJ/EryC1/StrS family aminotransferase [Ruminococcus sp.]